MVVIQVKSFSFMCNNLQSIELAYSIYKVFSISSIGVSFFPSMCHSGHHGALDSHERPVLLCQQEVLPAQRNSEDTKLEGNEI